MAAPAKALLHSEHRYHPCMASSGAATGSPRKTRIGYTSDTYIHRRNIIGRVDEYDYRRVYDLNMVFLAGSLLVGDRLPVPPFPDVRDLRFGFRDFNLNRVDLVHLSNAVSYGSTPWVTSFETMTPRFRATLGRHQGPDCGYASLATDKKVARALEALAGNACRSVIALSDCALAIQRELISVFPDLRSSIEPKLTTLHPPQEPLVSEPTALGPDEPIRFIFVGGSFIRKGGREILDAFRQVRRETPYIRLIVVSSLQIDPYATQEGEKEVETARCVLEENEAWIDYYPGLPNREVLELMKSSHVGLLPTHADTYGYSLLEFQASGLPVISTDVRALSEINNDDAGWLIRVPKNRLGEALYTTAEDRRVLGETIRKGLVAAIREIAADRASITRKGAAALELIRQRHSPDEHSRRLRAIYEEALFG